MGHEKEVSRTTQGHGSESIKNVQDVSNTLNILDSFQIRTNPFGANISGENSYKRAERISAALHLVTNNVPNDEPLRKIIRDNSINLISIIMDLRSGIRGAVSEKGQMALASIRELISLIRLLAVAGFISVQNANVIAEALDELGSLIVVSQRSVLAEQLTMSRDQLIPSGGAVSARNVRMKQARASANEQVISTPEETTTFASQSQRGERVMDILRLGGMLGIRDISANLPQYSEKMVQRELAQLIEAGKVRKLGAKRWSRYQLI